MILLIDNYDSFAYNLYQLIGSIDANIKVIRNDEMTVDQIEKLNPDAIIILQDLENLVKLEILKKLSNIFMIKNLF
ncbi:MAG: hypothetical protein V8R64_05845 [Thomasclavelia sp.]